MECPTEKLFEEGLRGASAYSVFRCLLRELLCVSNERRKQLDAAMKCLKLDLMPSTVQAGLLFFYEVCSPS